MNFNFLGRVSRLAAIGAILLGSASCIDINEELGENFIPTDQKWDVYTPEAAELKEIRMQMSDSLSGYSTTRFTFGAVSDSRFGTNVKSTSFTLVPLYDTLDFGENLQIRQFHFTAVRDTLSVVRKEQLRMLQNVHVSELKKALDSTVLYTGAFMNPEIRAQYLNTEEQITVGTPVYDGGDSLSFDFSREFTKRFIEQVKKADLDSMSSRYPASTSPQTFLPERVDESICSSSASPHQTAMLQAIMQSSSSPQNIRVNLLTLLSSSSSDRQSL